VDIGFLDLENSEDVELITGGGLYFQVSDYDLGSPFDMTVGGFVEYFTAERGGWRDYSDLALGLSLAISRPLRFENGFKVIPYGETNLRVDHIDNHDVNDDDFNLGFNIGAAIPLTGKVELTAEAQLDDQFGFLVGVGFLMW
jgi:hypothetical protein